MIELDQISVNNFPNVEGIIVKNFYCEGQQYLCILVDAKIPVLTVQSGVSCDETTALVALNWDNGTLAFRMLLPDPCTALLPNWSSEGVFVCSKLQAMEEDSNSTLDDVLSLVVANLRGDLAAVFPEEAVNRNAVSWLFDHDAQGLESNGSGSTEEQEDKEQDEIISMAHRDGVRRTPERSEVLQLEHRNTSHSREQTMVMKMTHRPPTPISAIEDCDVNQERDRNTPFPIPINSTQTVPYQNRRNTVHQMRIIPDDAVMNSDSEASPENGTDGAQGI